MLREQAWRRHRRVTACDRLRPKLHIRKNVAQLLDADCARPKHGRWHSRQVHDRGFDADVDRAGIEHDVDATVQVGEHVGSASRAWPREQVGAGRSNG